MSIAESTGRLISSTVLSREERERLRKAPIADAGHGFDVFGLSRDHLPLSLAVVKPLYRGYFRVRSYGAERVPAKGPAIIAANHSGMLPVDGMMLWTDVVTRVGRVPRVVSDHFVPALPFVGTFFARSGMVGGSRGNLMALLEAGELLALFPEGTPGIGKGFARRYQLQNWRVGHAELAIRFRAPVVPVAVVGAEESWIQIAKLRRLGHLFGWPHIPVPLTPLPLPARYHILYGEPLALHEGRRPEDADNPQVVHAASQRVKAEVEKLVARGLSLRKGVFR
ncbi:MAG: 1-acyl-sn-glycerol-3-phosphate acyltransferase [Myxococcaceae bacterium]